MKNLYLIGAGGHCKSCIDVIESTGAFKIKGLFDLKQNQGKKIGAYEILGGDEDIQKFVRSENEFLITLGQIKSAEGRVRIADLLQRLDAKSATVISPRAYVSPTAKIAPGTIIMHDALVNSYATVGQHCILNTKSLLEHDAVVEDFCHVSTGAILNGDVKLKTKSFVGSLSVLQEGLVVPEGSVLPAGVFHRKERPKS
jgi:sugar O-acyltransferase (sialic acid O-acetyltransferase NeuD family)